MMHIFTFLLCAETALDVEDVIIKNGAIPATIGVVDGKASLDCASFENIFTIV